MLEERDQQTYEVEAADAAAQMEEAVYNRSEATYSKPKKSKKGFKAIVATGLICSLVGGGIGGMEAALTCAEYGHHVILCEKTGVLGGSIRCEKEVDRKSVV